MFKNSILLFLLMFSLNSCSLYHWMLYPVSNLDEGLSKLNNSNIKVAYRYLGKPDGVKKYNNENIYTWHTYFRDFKDRSCYIEITTTKEDTIKSHNVTGDPYGCKKYTKSFQ